VSMITQAASSFFSDIVIDMAVDEILHMTEQRFIDE
jgi:NifU-like protein involved in Fe-S cluster formation